MYVERNASNRAGFAVIFQLALDRLFCLRPRYQHLHRVMMGHWSLMIFVCLAALADIIASTWTFSAFGRVRGTGVLDRGGRHLEVHMVVLLEGWSI